LSKALPGLGVGDLRSLADALEGGRVAPPYSAVSLQRCVPAPVVEEVSAELRSWSERGIGPVQLAFTLPWSWPSASGRSALPTTSSSSGAGPSCPER